MSTNRDNWGYRVKYLDMEKRYKEAKKAGKPVPDDCKTNYFLLHFGMYDYANKNPSIVEKYLDTKRLGYSGGGEF